MRFLTAVFLLPLVTVSGFTHHHDEQHVLDAASDTQSRVDTDVASEGMTYQDLEQQHTAQIYQEVEDLTTLQDQLQAEVDTAGEAKLWPFTSKNKNGGILKQLESWINRGSINTEKLLMKEASLIKATEKTPPQFKHNLLDIKPYTNTEVTQLKTIHDSWIKTLKWLNLGTGYEFNWARMWEPVTQQYRSYVPAVKSQRCGTCWDFSTSAMISSHMAIKYSIDRPIQWDPETVNPISLSEGELFECTGASGVDDVCNGNWIQNAAARVKATGIAQNVDYQFTGSLTTNANQCRGNACGPKCPVKPPATNAAPVKNCNYWPQTCPALTDKRRSDNPRFKIDNLVSVTNPSGDPANPTNAWVGSAKNPLQLEQIRNLLRTKGPLGFYFRVESGFTMPGNDVWPNDGAIYTKACTGAGINHAMVIVGYGRTPATHPKQPNMDYWIVLNSWGNWSTDGFIKIQAGVNLCSAENIAFYPELPAADLAASDPCASQGSELKKIQCFLSLCDNTILSTSRYCQSKGRANFCKRVKDSKPAICPNACPPPPRSISGKVTSIFTPKCKPECQMYDKVCRLWDFKLDIKNIYQDYIKPLDTRIAEARIGVPLDNLAIAKVDPQPIKTPFDTIFQRQYGNQQTMVASNGNVATQAKTA